MLKGEVPMFHMCNVDRHAATTTLAMLAQQHGALGVIIEKHDEVYITILSPSSSFNTILSSFFPN